MIERWSAVWIGELAIDIYSDLKIGNSILDFKASEARCDANIITMMACDTVSSIWHQNFDNKKLNSVDKYFYQCSCMIWHEFAKMQKKSQKIRFCVGVDWIDSIPMQMELTNPEIGINHSVPNAVMGLSMDLMF